MALAREAAASFKSGVRNAGLFILKLMKLPNAPWPAPVRWVGVGVADRMQETRPGVFEMFASRTTLAADLGYNHDHLGRLLTQLREGPLRIFRRVRRSTPRGRTTDLYILDVAWLTQSDKMPGWVETQSDKMSGCGAPGTPPTRQDVGGPPDKMSPRRRSAPSEPLQGLNVKEGWGAGKGTDPGGSAPEPPALGSASGTHTHDSVDAVVIEATDAAAVAQAPEAVGACSAAGPGAQPAADLVAGVVQEFAAYGLTREAWVAVMREDDCSQPPEARAERLRSVLDNGEIRELLRREAWTIVVSGPWGRRFVADSMKRRGLTPARVARWAAEEQERDAYEYLAEWRGDRSEPALVQALDAYLGQIPGALDPRLAALDAGTRRVARERERRWLATREGVAA